jgi:hypothetical protein
MGEDQEQGQEASEVRRDMVFVQAQDDAERALKLLRRPRGGDRATKPGTALPASETWMSAIPWGRGPVATCY